MKNNKIEIYTESIKHIIPIYYLFNEGKHLALGS